MWCVKTCKLLQGMIGLAESHLSQYLAYSRLKLNPTFTEVLVNKTDMFSCKNS